MVRDLLKQDTRPTGTAIPLRRVRSVFKDLFGTSTYRVSSYHFSSNHPLIFLCFGLGFFFLIPMRCSETQFHAEAGWGASSASCTGCGARLLQNPLAGRVAEPGRCGETGWDGAQVSPGLAPSTPAQLGSAPQRARGAFGVLAPGRGKRLTLQVCELLFVFSAPFLPRGLCQDGTAAVHCLNSGAGDRLNEPRPLSGSTCFP